MSYTEKEFNEAMAELDDVRRCQQCPHIIGDITERDCGFPDCYPDYYNDLNYLMSLVFKYDFQIYKSSANEWNCEIWMNDDQDLIVWKNTDPLKTIRDCLFELSQERK